MCFCRKTGHKVSQCRIKQRKEKVSTEPENVKPVSPDLSAANPSVATRLPIHPLFKQYCTQAHIVKADGTLLPINALRDTGALQAVIRKSCVFNSDYVPTGDFRLLKGISSELIEVPLVELHLKTDVLDGNVFCGLIEELPEGVDFLLGNDLACVVESAENVPLTQSVITRAQAAAQQRAQTATVGSTLRVTDNSATSNETVENVAGKSVDECERLFRLTDSSIELESI
jgi:hypothetical protein